MTQIAQETVAQCLPDIGPLLEAHWREVALYQDAVPLKPDFERYRQLEAAGRLVVVTAREDGELIGYSVFFLHQHIHYSSCLVGSNDVLFLSKAHRERPGVGIRLIRASESALREKGVQRVTWHVKPGNDWSDVLARLGYALEEKIMGRLLGEQHGV